jgi:nucleoside-diphosphate-sugar epimerase
MVIPSLISRFASEELPIKIWGDGTAVRDFIYCEDVANGMIDVIEKNYTLPVNLGSGTGTRISEIAEILLEIFPNKEIIWDSKMPKGDDIRLMDTTRAESIGIKSKIDIKKGLTKTVDWYLNHRDLSDFRYNAFKEKR